MIKHGHQEGVEHGYVGNGDQTEKCYQYLFFRLHELNTFLYGTIRAGSAHSQNGISLYLRRFLPMFKRSGRQLRLRGDSGFFNEESFDICHENDTFFYIKAPMSPTRREQAASDKINWQEMQMGSGVYYASRITYTAKGTMWREVFKRQEIEDEAALFPTYRYDCVATNDLKAGDEAVFDFYNGRANIENNIREIKHDYHLGRVVTSSFTANDAITQTIMVAYVLVQHFKRIALEEKDQRMQLQTLRWRLFAMPCRTISSGRAVWFRLTGIFFDERAYLRVLHKIRMTLSVLVSPPPDIVFN